MPEMDFSEEDGIHFISLIPEDPRGGNCRTTGNYDSEEESVKTSNFPPAEAAACVDHCRKRDDIRSSGSARPGETPPSAGAARPHRKRPLQNSSLSRTLGSSLLLRYCLMWLTFGGAARFQGVMAIQLPDIYWNATNPM